MSVNSEVRHQIAKRAVQELADGAYVNLGIGIPMLMMQYLPLGKKVVVMTESGLLGVGDYPDEKEVDSELINSAKETITASQGSAFFSSADAFDMIRGGHLDISFLGALEVDERGNLANWMVPGKMVMGMGGAMDLAVGAKRLVVTMKHTSQDRKPKILRKCSLPLTALGVVDRIITELAVIDVTQRGLILREVAPQVSVEEVCHFTEAPLEVDKDLKIMMV
jgi:3-oxoacid CoA-transferase subunit B